MKRKKLSRNVWIVSKLLKIVLLIYSVFDSLNPKKLSKKQYSVKNVAFLFMLVSLYLHIINQNQQTFYGVNNDLCPYCPCISRASFYGN